MKAKLGDYVKFRYYAYTPKCGRIVNINFSVLYPYLVGSVKDDWCYPVAPNEIIRIYKDRYKKPSNKRSK